jgi:phosphoribosylformimino-5-aminoimidazole carboxamide ribotide isomerase
LQIIPVIDLMQGQVVHARRGARDRYQPLQSRLCSSSDPLDVVSGLLALYPFETLYIADLDAIRATGDHSQCIARLRRNFGGLTLWVDAAIGNWASFELWQSQNLAHAVIGSESLADLGILERLRMEQLHATDAKDFPILSLDFRGDEFLGPTEVLDAPDLWPERVIAMTLNRVGSGEGPDLERIQDLRRKAPDKRIYAAGGVRNGDDLDLLSQRGVSGVLIATALHDGRIGLREISAQSAIPHSKPSD